MNDSAPMFSQCMSDLVKHWVMQDIVAIYWFNCPNCSIGTDIVGWNSGNIMVNESSFWWGTEVIGKAFRVIYLFTGEDKVVIDIWGWRFFNYIKDRTFQTNLVALQLLNKWRWYLAMLNCKIIYCKTLIFCRQIK